MNVKHMNFENLKYKGKIGFYASLWSYKIYHYLKYGRLNDAIYLKKIFPLAQGYPLNLDDPKSLNEKMQWLKIHDRRNINTILADKYLAREYIAKHFGNEFLIPLLFKTEKVSEINPDILPHEPFIIKVNHNSGNFQIVRNKGEINWNQLQVNLKWWMSFNYYRHSREWQYKNIKPIIIVEKLLLDKMGKIPNDYKLHCINGKVAFVYVSVDREGSNKRNIYDRNWKPMDFTFAHKYKHKKGNIRGVEINAPSSFEMMVNFAERVAQLYTYIRVDFYDVDGKLYFGEITHQHGGGFDQFRPIEWDYYFGEQLNLNAPTLDNL